MTPADGVLLAASEPFDLRLPPGSRGLVATMPPTAIGDRLGSGPTGYRNS